MGRFALLAVFGLIAALTPVAEVWSDAAVPSPASPPAALPVPMQGPPAPGGGEQQEDRNAIEHRAADLRRQVSSLQGLAAQVRQQIAHRRAWKPLAGNSGGQQEARAEPAEKAADLHRQDSELHDQLQSLLAQLAQELQFELQSPPAADAAEQQERQVAREAFKHTIADLRQEDGELQELMTGYEQAVAQRGIQEPPAVPNLDGEQAVRDLLEHQAADMRNQIAELQRQNDALERQLAEQKKALAKSTQELDQRTRDLDTARAEAEGLRRTIEVVRQQPRAEQASVERQKAQPQKVAAPAQPALQQRTPRPTQPMPVQQQPQSPPNTQPPALAQQPEPMPMPSSVTQRLETARQWLSVGRPDVARDLLATVQTQMVFQPMTPDQPITLSHNPSATDVGDAIRWLDIGATEQAMWSITRAIEF